MTTNKRSSVVLGGLRAAAAVMVTAAAVGGLAASAQAQPPPMQTTDQSLDITVDTCGFPVRVQIEDTERALDFGDRLGFTYSAAHATLTNLVSGAVLGIATPGPELIDFNDDGTVTFRGPGPWLWLRAHPVTNAPGIWLTYGLIIQTYENRDPISAEQHGTSRNLCTALDLAGRVT